MIIVNMAGILSVATIVFFSAQLKADATHQLAGNTTYNATAISHAPIGVMGDHLHNKGEWMLSYRFMNMHMEGMRSGTDDVSAAEVSNTRNPLAGETMRMGSNLNATIPPFYRISPVEMEMRMHMFGVMYGISDSITLMTMLSYVENEMTLATFGGGMPAAMNGGGPEIGQFTGKTSGIGDTRVSALIKLIDQQNTKLHYSLGLSLPTGSITESGSVLAPNGNMVSIDRLAYPMQLGSGSYDFLPGITYNGINGELAWGAQLSGTLRLADNDENYRLGNIIEGTTWLAKQWMPSFSSSIRLLAKSEGSIKGRDSVITGGMPLFVAENSGRDEIDLLLGINLLSQQGILEGNRLALEIGAPIYENVDGLQMSKDWTVTLGWQKAF